MTDSLEQREEFKTAHFDGKNLDGYNLQLSESDDEKSSVLSTENQAPFKDK